MNSKIEVQISGNGTFSEICIFLCMDYLANSNYFGYNIKAMRVFPVEKYYVLAYGIAFEGKECYVKVKQL